MTGGERLLLAWCGLLFAVVVCILAGSFLPWSGHRILHSATAAAWAQTAGTVAAMLCGAGAIAWQVRFETRREARAELHRDLRSALEIQELVAYAGRHLEALRQILVHGTPEEAAAHVIDLDRDMTWHDLREAFNETPIATLPGARLKLAFIRAKSGYSMARGAYDALWQAANSGMLFPSDPTLTTLEKAAFMLNAAFEQTRAVAEIVKQHVEKV